MAWITILIPVVLVVVLVFLIFRRKGTKNSSLDIKSNTKSDTRKDKLGMVIEFIFLLAVALGFLSMIITLIAAIMGQTWIWFAWAVGGTFGALVMTYFVRITNNIYSLLMEQKQTAKMDEHTYKE